LDLRKGSSVELHLLLLCFFARVFRKATDKRNPASLRIVRTSRTTKKTVLSPVGLVLVSRGFLVGFFFPLASAFAGYTHGTGRKLAFSFKRNLDWLLL
jgi:hypothetical protein